MTSSGADALVLFGVTGDLARRRLFPALYALVEDGELEIPVVGVSRTDQDSESLRRRARAAIEEAVGPVDERVFERLAMRLHHVRGDYRDSATYDAIKLAAGDRACVVSYLAIPPALFDDVIRGLAAVGLNHNGRLMLEKPFGRDTSSAQELSQIVHQHYPEENVYRIDHFLGKEALQNLMVFRFSNTILEPIWNRHFVRGVQITLAEDFDIEGRGAFYDSVGATRDVFQNHLLVMLSLLAMEPPVSEDADALQDERIKVLKATKPLQVGDVVTGQYSGYRSETGVAEDSETETYIAARLEVDSWRWAGVPWIIRTGKGLRRTVTEAVVEFRRPPRLLFSDQLKAPGPNRIAFQTKPDDRIVLSLQSKRPGSEIVSDSVNLSLDYEEDRGDDAYKRLLADAIHGDRSLFSSINCVMEAWRIVQPIIDDPVVPQEYPRGSTGPKTADALLGDDWEWLTL